MPVGPLLILKSDLNGTIESRVFPIDFTNAIAAGDSLTGTPIIEQVNEIGGTLALTIGSPAISGKQVLVRITGGSLNAIYDLSCTVSTTGGDVLVSSWGIKISPSK